MTSAAGVAVRPLSHAELGRLTDWGRDRHAIDRALAMLRVAAPDSSAEELEALPIGRRDALLLSLREQMFGGDLALRSACPTCGEEVEFATSTRAITVPPPDHGPGPWWIEAVGRRICVRLPDSRDLAALIGARSPQAAKAALLSGCVVQAAGPEGAGDGLPNDVLDAVAAAILALDPQAEVAFRLTCPACGVGWRAAADIGAVLWIEVEAEYRRAQRDVAALARVFGWSEADVLAMSPARRAAYLELAADG